MTIISLGADGRCFFFLGELNFKIDCGLSCRIPIRYLIPYYGINMYVKHFHSAYLALVLLKKCLFLHKKIFKIVYEYVCVCAHRDFARVCI